MIRLDSTHIELPLYGVHSFTRESFTLETSETLPGVFIKDRHELRKDIHAVGINNIALDQINETAKFRISAKLLHDDYFDGINIHNIERVVHSINQSGIIRVCPDIFINEGRVFNVDETHNVDMGQVLTENWQGISSELAVSVLNPKFQPNVNNTRRNQGITFKGNQTSQKNRLIMYNKALELKKAGNRLFMASLKRPMLLLERAQHQLRCELNMTDFKFIRDRFNVDSLKLADILTASGQPIVDMMDKITMPGTMNQLELILKSEYTGWDFFMMHGIENIIRLAEYDETKIKAVVKSKFSESNFRWVWYGRDDSKGVKKLIYELKHRDMNITRPKVVNHIRTELINDYAAVV